MNTVEPGYLELPAISNRIGFPLDLPLFFQSFTMGYLELGYLEHPAISNCSSSLKLKSTPAISNFSTFRRNISIREHLAGSEVQLRHLVTRWEMYWRVRGNESKVRLTGRTTVNAEGDKLPVFVILGIKLLFQKFDEPPLSRTISRYPWEFEIAGLYCIDIW